MTKKKFKRRQPKVERKEVVMASQPEQCPGCPHKPSVHNQFGCCFEEAVCTCLLPFGKGEDKDGEDLS